MADVTCRECGKALKRIVTHLKVHQMKLADYTAKHPDAPLNSDEYLQALSTQTRRAMNTPAVRENFLRGLAKRRDFSGENNPFFGKSHTAEFRKRHSENRQRVERMLHSSAWWNEYRRGKTAKELFGESRAEAIRVAKSKRFSGQNNPAYGKVYKNAGGRGVQGRYKGRFFRSTYEFSFLKHLEERGVDLSSVLYEAHCIPYEFSGVQRTYIPDFQVGDVLYEVKSVWFLEQLSEMNRAKFAAATVYCRERGLGFTVVTERDFKVYSATATKRDPFFEAAT